MTLKIFLEVKKIVKNAEGIDIPMTIRLLSNRRDWDERSFDFLDLDDFFIHSVQLGGRRSARF